jgi:hypothetical protein
MHGQDRGFELLSHQAAAIPRSDNAMVYSANLQHAAISGILDYPGHYLLTVLKHQPRLYTRTPAIDILSTLGDREGAAAADEWWRDWRAWRRAPSRVLLLEVICYVSQTLLYVFTLVGLWKLWRNRCLEGCGILLSVLLYFAFIIGPLDNPRYRMVMLPAFAVAASCSLLQSNRRTPA